MAATTANELILIGKFRSELKGLLDDERLANDDFLLRWIRARSHDLGKAKEMLVNHLKWYSEKQIATISSIPRPPYFDLHFKHYYTEGQDKTGRPLYIAPVGKWNIKELLRLNTPDGIILEFARVMEVMRARVEAAAASGVGRGPDGNGMTQMIAIGDFHGFGWSQANSWPTIQKMLDFGSTFEAHYPELVCTLYHINCPRLFMWLGGMIRKCFPAGSQHKLQFYGGVEEWGPVLREVIDEKYLGVLHGGGGGGEDDEKNVSGK